MNLLFKNLHLYFVLLTERTGAADFVELLLEVLGLLLFVLALFDPLLLGLYDDVVFVVSVPRVERVGVTFSSFSFFSLST